MATQALDRDQLDLTASRKTLILVWQNPESRLFAKVGQLDALPSGRFAFHYLPGAWDDPAFVPLLEYPDRDTAYVSDEVPAFFANRILSADRPNYVRYLRWLGIDDLSLDDVPFEVLARTGGGRATDTFHVVELPVTDGNRLTSRFFVSGVRHFPDSEGVIANLQNGATLRLELEETNDVNPKAVLVNTADGHRFGYVPDWLCGDVHARLKGGWSITAVAERVNPDAPAHIRVLCRLDAARI
ncbi:HIRAN domain-containing protein [uncultured Microbacterium sp.]|uniref:HIRAN domain-containing protein n=1 Tax=uncultured Microbacterium sp. TaxID=191216 RepID=UPI0025D8FB65|nr:HIRAN domain-containing protein [uncultured Microbacterium sp.]